MAQIEERLTLPFHVNEDAPTEGVCLGFCCEAFPILLTMDERQRMIDWIAAGHPPEGWKRDDGEVCHSTYRDARVSPEFIRDMLIPLDRYVLDGTRRQMHSCKHWDPNSRLCTIYEDRPSLCRTYPNYGPCDHAAAGCTFRRIDPASIPSPSNNAPCEK